MTADNSKRAQVDEALLELGFTPADKFGAFVTYRRMSLKVHVGPDGAFAAFGADDEIILGEGQDAEDLRSILAESNLGFAARAGARRG